MAADAFTVTQRLQAIVRTAEDRRYRSIAAIKDRVSTLERRIANGDSLDEIKAAVIDMREWCWAGPLAEAAWFDGRLFNLAEHLATDEELRELNELAARSTS
jgi:hypothetical protein